MIPYYSTTPRQQRRGVTSIYDLGEDYAESHSWYLEHFLCWLSPVVCDDLCVWPCKLNYFPWNRSLSSAACLHCVQQTGASITQQETAQGLLSPNGGRCTRSHISTYWSLFIVFLLCLCLRHEKHLYANGPKRLKAWQMSPFAMRVHKATGIWRCLIDTFQQDVSIYSRPKGGHTLLGWGCGKGVCRGGQQHFIECLC